ncbi:MAG: hypothetical protein KDC92_14880, partial [Bacteroidetes bacterium]|nr:hypothetical protein [Bacteroidota bacterium]
MMKIAIKALMLAAVVVFSACGNTEELEAQKAKVDDLTRQLSDMKTMFEQMKQEQDEEAKAQLDASGIAVVDQYKLLLEYEGYIAA